MNRSTAFLTIGIVMISAGFAIAGVTYFPVVRDEVGFRLHAPRTDVTVKTGSQLNQAGNGVIYPVDEEFSLVIPKIGANSKVIADVDPFDSKQYQQALTKGVAHARGTSLPGQPGNIFLFSHSSVNFFEASRYNSIFYLLNKMEPGDEIFIVFKGTVYKYSVTDRAIVPAHDVTYLKGSGSGQTLTLMTCWPAGTTLKRLVVQASQEES